MKKILLLLTVLLTGLLSASAEESTVTFEGTSKPSATNNSFSINTPGDIATWNFSFIGGSLQNVDPSRGLQFGSKNSPVSTITAKTADIPGTITSIVVNTNGSNTPKFDVNITVGGQAFDAAKTITSQSATDYTFNGNGSGEIVVTWSNTKTTAKRGSAMYVKSIVVTYQPTTNPEVAPSTPVVTFGETTCVNDEVYEVPYLTEVSVTSENAQSIKVGDVEYPGSSCKFAVKESDIYTIQSVNTTGVSEEVNVYFETTAIDPALSFNPAEVELYLGDEFTAPVLNAPEELTTFTYESSNTEVAEVDNTGKVTIKAIGENVTITVKSAAVAYKYNEGTATYTINVLDPETRPIQSEFNFATNSPYGMYNYSGNVQKYEEDRTDKAPVTSITEGKVTLTFSGQYRAWDSKDLRIRGNATGATPGQIVITPNDPNYEIESVSYKGSTISLSKANFDASEWGKEVIIKSSSTSTASLTSLTVTLRKLPEMNSAPTYDQQGTVITFSCTDPAYMLQYRIYIPEWDKEQPAQGPARVMAEQDWTDNEAGLGQDFKHEVPENEGKYVIEVRQYHKGLVSPTSSFYVAEDGNVSGIEDVVIENAPAVYYNLQGVRVEGDLTPGLYIRRSGNTTTKVIVR